MASDIVSRLKISGFDNKLVVNKPDDVDAFDGISFDVSFIKPGYDLIFAFIFSLDEFTAIVSKVIDESLLKPNGYLYFAYPKKGNKKYKQYIGRDDFFTPVRMDKDGFVNGSRIKFNKMMTFSDVFTCIGLKHIETATKASGKPKPSQCVGDYIDRIPELQKHFADNKTVLELYNSLTPGYQRDWARYVFSAQTEATVQKRLVEMEAILKQGYKSKDLYRQNKNK